MLDLSGVLALRGAYRPLPAANQGILVFVTDVLGHSKSNFPPFSQYLSAVSKVTTPDNNHLARHFNIVLIHC